MSSTYASFLADDTPVQVVPLLDLPQTTNLLSTGPLRPLRAGLPATVPLWLARQWQDKSLARLVAPEWLTVDNLKEILRHEQTHELLWNDDQKLPYDYYPLGLAFCESGNVSNPAVSLLLHDLLQVRLDKLEQQFLQHLAEGADPDFLVQVDGIGSQELALLRGIITQALADRWYLSGVGGQGKEGEKMTDPQRAAGATAATSTTTTTKRVPLRRFRR